MRKIIQNLGTRSIENRNKRILNNFYSREIGKGKTRRANFLDNVSTYLILGIILTFFLTYNLGNFFLSIYMTFIILFFFSAISKGIFNKRKTKNIEKINEDLKSKKLIKDFSHYKKVDFVSYLKPILEEYYSMEIVDGDSTLDLIGIKENEKYGIRCLKTTMDDRVSLRELDLFYKDLKVSGINDGIFITNSYFSDEVKNEAKVILHDFESLKEIFKATNRYPKQEEIESYIIDRFNDRRNVVKKEITMINKGKIYKLYGIFIVFYTLSYFVKYSMYYKIMGVIAFVMATLLGGYKISEYIKDKRNYPFT